MKLLIKNGRVIDPVQKIDEKMDVVIENDKIVDIKKQYKGKVNKTIDAKDKIVMPGIIDIHTHLREPGEERKETIASGTRAAAKGGVTSICCMPNTKPPIDNAPSVEYILLKAQKEGIVNVFPVGCITKGQQGESLAEIGSLYNAGVVAISDDGHPVMNSEIMRRAIEYSRMFNIPIVSHCEDINLAKDGSMNSGFMSTKLGLRGIPNAAEEVMVARDIILAENYNGHVHLAHISTFGSVELIRAAKKRGVKVTCETAPHYFTLTDEAVNDYNTNAKMNPPLRTERDVKAIIAGLKDGTIDAIATDHAPHTEEQKSREFELAPFGIIGLETMLSLSYEYLVEKNKISLMKVIEKLTANPAKIMNLSNRGSLAKGNLADITIFDDKKTWVLDPNNIKSKSKNTPFLNWELKGVVTQTLVSGKLVYTV